MRARIGLAVAVAVAGLLVVAASSPAAAGTAGVVYSGSGTARVVALTFDDGWSAENTRRIFDILRRRHVMATFFPYARAVAGAPALWKAIAVAGYPIANHTTNHPDLTTLPAWRVRAELETARTTIERITGRPMVRVFRPPYGAWNAMVLHEAAAAGFVTAVLWDVSSADTAQHSSWGSIARAAMRGGNGSIVLMHGGPDVTPAILDSVITSYASRGFRFVTIPQLLGSKRAPWPTPTPVKTPKPTLPICKPTPSPSGTPAASTSPTPESSATPGASGSPDASAAPGAGGIPGASGSPGTTPTPSPTPRATAPCRTPAPTPSPTPSGTTRSSASPTGSAGPSPPADAPAGAPGMAEPPDWDPAE